MQNWIVAIVGAIGAALAVLILHTLLPTPSFANCRENYVVRGYTFVSGIKVPICGREEAAP
jgi:hypothetical protein